MKMHCRGSKVFESLRDRLVAKLGMKRSASNNRSKKQILSDICLKQLKNLNNWKK